MPTKIVGLLGEERSHLIELEQISKTLLDPQTTNVTVLVLVGMVCIMEFVGGRVVQKNTH